MYNNAIKLILHYESLFRRAPLFIYFFSLYRHVPHSFPVNCLNFEDPRDRGEDRLVGVSVPDLFRSIFLSPVATAGDYIFALSLPLSLRGVATILLRGGGGEN